MFAPPRVSHRTTILLLLAAPSLCTLAVLAVAQAILLLVGVLVVRLG